MSWTWRGWLWRFLAAWVFAFLLAVAVWQTSKTLRFQLLGEMVTRVETTEPVVALTFDDGPSLHGTDPTLEILAQHDVPATFFLTGHELEAYPELGRRIVESGHALGNHSYAHERMIGRSPGWVRREIERTDDLIRRAGFTGEIPFRPPYGNRFVVLPWVLARSERPAVFWDVAPESYPEHSTSAEAMAAFVVDTTRPGSIILLHTMYPSRDKSRRAVPMVIEGLKAKGFRFVTVPELLARR